MKKYFLVLSLVLLCAALFVSCTTVAPFDATSNPVGQKVGEASASYLFGIIPLGSSDTGIQKAAKNGGISEISTVDVKTMEGIFVRKVTTVVTGK